MKFKLIKKVAELKYYTCINSVYNEPCNVFVKTLIPGHLLESIKKNMLFIHIDFENYEIEFSEKHFAVFDINLKNNQVNDLLFESLIVLFDMEKSNYTENYVCKITKISPRLGYTKVNNKQFMFLYDYFEGEERTPEINTILIDSIYQVEFDHDQFMRLITPQ